VIANIASSPERVFEVVTANESFDEFMPYVPCLSSKKALAARSSIISVSTCPSRFRIGTTGCA